MFACVGAPEQERMSMCMLCFCCEYDFVDGVAAQDKDSMNVWMSMVFFLSSSTPKKIG